MTDIVTTIENDWSVAINVVKTLLTTAEDASPLLTDLKNLITSFEGKPTTTATTATPAPLEPTIASETQSTTDALNTPIVSK